MSRIRVTLHFVIDFSSTVLQAVVIIVNSDQQVGAELSQPVDIPFDARTFACTEMLIFEENIGK